MKKTKNLILIVVMIFLIIFNTTTSYGIEYDNFEPKIDIDDLDNSETIIKIESILSVLSVVGVIVTVILLAVLGFFSILGSAEEKHDIQFKLTGFIVGAILITATSTIAKIIIEFSEKIV